MFREKITNFIEFKKKRRRRKRNGATLMALMNTTCEKIAFVLKEIQLCITYAFV